MTTPTEIRMKAFQRYFALIEHLADGGGVSHDEMEGLLFELRIGTVEFNRHVKLARRRFAAQYRKPTAQDAPGIARTHLADR